MSKNWKSVSGYLVVLLTMALSADGQTAPPDRVAQDLASIKGAYRIVITEWTSQHTNRMVIVLGDVPRIINTVHLERKEECYCFHTLHATFKSAEGEVAVSFCDHCFDIADPGGEDRAHHYKMPKEFYAELRRQVKQQGRDEFEQLKP